MNKKYIFPILLFLGLTCHFYVSAQVEDTQLRQNIGVNWKQNKKLDISANYRLDYKQNLSTFRRSNFSLNTNYEINKWLSISMMYRYAMMYSRDFHRLRMGIKAKKDIFPNIQISYRTMLQHDINYFEAEYLRTYDPKWILRNKVEVKYAISTKMNAFIYTDIFARNALPEFGFYRLRTGVGVNYTYKKRNHFTLEYFYQNEFNIKSPFTIQILNLDYNFDLQKTKKKKKKKK